MKTLNPIDMKGTRVYGTDQRVKDMEPDLQALRLRTGILEEYFSQLRFTNRRIFLLEAHVSGLRSEIAELRQVLIALHQNRFAQVEIRPHSDGESLDVSNRSMPASHLRLSVSSSDDSDVSNRSVQAPHLRLSASSSDDSSN